MKIFGKYIWQYRFVLLLFLLCAGIFAGFFSLYNLEVEAVLYAAGWCFLCAAAGITGGIRN